MGWMRKFRFVAMVLTLAAACKSKDAAPPEHAKPIESVAPAAPAPASDSIAIAIVFNGQEIWVGNDDFETDENALYRGALKNLEAAIDKAQLKGAAGSKAVVVSYSTGAELRVPLVDLDKLTGGGLGAQKDYKGKIGTDMVQGIAMAQAELSKTFTARKAIIVVGDGNDTNNEEAHGYLSHLASDLAKQKVQLFAVIYKSAVSADDDVITSVVPGATHVNSADGLASELASIVAKLRGG